jgi:IS30 family transposase/DNA-binding CsgD family transcriptional regulator
MAGSGLDPWRERRLLELVASGMTPNKAAGVAGMAVSTAYAVVRRSGGVPWREAVREAASARAAEAAAGASGRDAAVLGLIASGLPPYKAARAAGVSAGVAYRLAKKMTGVSQTPPEAPDAPGGGRYLSREERYEIARLRDQGLSVRQVAARLCRPPSTVSRELRRNADPRTGGYQPERAHGLARRRQRRPRPSKLSRNPRLRAAVQGMLNRRYSPEQASGRLKVDYPGDPEMRVSHETVYQSIYVYPRGELKRELKAGLRRGRSARRPRGRGPEARGRIAGAVPIGQRPPEAEGRLVPGHHEGDLVMGSAASNSAVGTVVERVTGYLTLIHLPRGHTADAVADAVIDRLTALPSWFASTLTWDNGKEMASHARIAAEAGVQVYFADPYSPWQRGSNENTNGLLREYLPKGTDLSGYTAAQLRAIEDELNDRPRKRLGYHTPREELAKLLEQDRVATIP